MHTYTQAEVRLKALTAAPGSDALTPAVICEALLSRLPFTVSFSVSLHLFFFSCFLSTYFSRLTRSFLLSPTV